MASMAHIARELEARRRELGMSQAAVAKRSGVSLRCVQRALSGEGGDVRLSSLAALAEALGAEIGLRRGQSVEAMRERQAEKKAAELTGVAQGSAALEGQAVGRRTLEAAKRRTKYSLLSGPGLRLWA